MTLLRYLYFNCEENNNDLGLKVARRVSSGDGSSHNGNEPMIHEYISTLVNTLVYRDMTCVTLSETEGKMRGATVVLVFTLLINNKNN